uniref:Short chain dehydrogenase/reductase family 16C, member 5a n=1 Tax=Hucho hucho TaxID=62062 RepID=A0A4W5QL78_9TELE
MYVSSWSFILYCPSDSRRKMSLGKSSLSQGRALTGSWQRSLAPWAPLVLWDVNQEGMKETARLVKQKGATRVHYYLCDCSDKAKVKREVGDVSILINNAGIVTVNTMAHFWTYKAFLPVMTANNHGHLVSIASSAGLIGVNGLADKSPTIKFAAIGFAESVALELLATGKDGVKTTIVNPYFINTGIFDAIRSKLSAIRVVIVFIRGYYPHCIFLIVFLIKSLR